MPRVERIDFLTRSGDIKMAEAVLRRGIVEIVSRAAQGHQDKDHPKTNEKRGRSHGRGRDHPKNTEGGYCQSPNRSAH